MSRVSRLVFLLILSLCSAAVSRAESIWFDGVNGHAVVGVDVQIPRFTVETWFKRDVGGVATSVNSTSSFPLISAGNASNYFLGIATDGRLHGELRSTIGSRVSVFSTTVPVGEWHHGALTFDGAFLRLYVDGDLKASSFVSQQPDTAPGGLRFGQIWDGTAASGAFAGRLDEVRLWNRARTQAEIQSHMGVPLEFSPGMVARWGFDGAPGLTATSSGIQQIAATLANGASFSPDVPPLFNTQPSAAITSPSGPVTATNSGTITFTATASDPDDGVAKVEYHDQFTKLGEATSAPYSFEWTPTIGNHIVRAVAVDASGKRNGSMQGVAVNINLIAGAGALYFDGTQALVLSPSSYSEQPLEITVESWFRIEGNGSPVRQSGAGDIVALVNKGMILGVRPTDNRLVGAFSNTTLAAAIGNTEISRGVWHHAAVTCDGVSVRLYLDGVLDGIMRTDVPNRQFVYLQTFVAGVSETTGLFEGQLDEVRVWNYARPMGAVSGAKLARNMAHATLIENFRLDEPTGTTFASSGTSGGTYTTLSPPIRTPAAPSQSGIAPTVNRTAPTTARTVNKGTAVTVSGTASDSDGIARVEFWDNETKLGQDTASPFSMSWATDRIGNRRVTVVAIDNTGLASSSTPIAVEVLAPAGTTAIALRGITSDAAQGDGTSLSFPAYTVETWFKREDLGIMNGFPVGDFIEPFLNNQAIGQMGNYLSFLLGIRQRDGVLVGGISTGTGSTGIAGTIQVPLHEWHHAALTHDGSVLKLYLDGVLAAEGPATPPQTGTMTLRVGAGPTNITSTFLGSLDELRIWNTARTQGEILGAKSLTLTSTPGLVARWAFNEATGTTANSVPGTSIPLTIAGSKTTGVTLVAGQLPTVSISNPASGASFPILTQITVACSASDPDGTVARVELYHDGVKLGERTTAPYNFPFTPVSMGTHAFRAVAYDNSGAAAGSELVNYTGLLPVGVDGLYFDGADDFVITPASESLGLPRFTVETWFRRDAGGTNVSIGSDTLFPLLARGSASEGFNFLLGINTLTGALSGGFTSYGGSPVTLSGSTAVPLSEWHHGAMSYDGTALRLFLDGTQIASVPANLTPRVDATFRVGIGASVSSGGTQNGAFRGFIDEPLIWDHARSGAVISADRWSSSFSGPGPAARWAFSEGAGTTVANTGSVSALTGTINGGGAWSIGRTPPSASVPMISLSASASGTVGQPFLLSASPASGDGITKVEFFVGATKLGEVASAPWEWSYTAASDSTVIFSAVATTVNGATAASNDVTVSFTQSGGGGLYLDGINAHVRLPASAELTAFPGTWEFWFKPTGAGIAHNTSTPIVPIISRGVTGNSVEKSDYVIGLSSARKLVAKLSDSWTATGSTTIQDNTWYHCAVTFSGTSQKVYLNGVLEATSTVSTTLYPRSVSAPAFATMLDSLGTARGAFQGVLDEVRLWNKELTATEINSRMNADVHGAPGLIARWGFANAPGEVTPDSGLSALSGVLRNGAAITSGAALVADEPPTVMLNSPVNNQIAPSPTTLEATVTGSNGELVSPTFYGRSIPRGRSDFTVVVLPDLSNYTASQNGGSPATLNAMMDWIVAERTNRNIVCVTQTGSVTAGIDATAETLVASSAFAKLENPATTGSAFGIPFGLAFGDTDVSAAFNAEFGPSRFAGKAWFGGSPSEITNVTHASFFNVGEAGYGIIHIGHEYPLNGASSSVVWAKALLAKNRDRQFMVVFHDLLASTGSGTQFSTSGTGLYLALNTEPNVLMLLGGNAAGEMRRMDVNAGRLYDSASANFSNRPNGGDGWMRLLEFSPSKGLIQAKTYSPTLNQFETDADSDFSLRWVPLAPNASWETISAGAPQASGPASAEWNTADGRYFEWYATVSDATSTVSSPARSFTTAVPVVEPPPTVALTSPSAPATLILSSVMALTATASGPEGIESVEFFADGFRIGADTTAPYSVLWQPTTLGTFQFTAVATSPDGLKTTSSPVSVTVNPSGGAIAPTVSITSPAAGTYVNPGTVTVTAYSSSGSITSVQFFVDGALIGTSTTAQFSVPWIPISGTHSIQAIATNSAGASGASLPVTVTVSFTGGITRAPYLQMPAPTAMTIRWRTANTHTGRVRYGTTAGNLNQFADDTVARTNHEVRISNLQPETRYYYSVGSASQVESGNDAGTFFVTSPLSGRARPTRIWALGDAGQGNAGQMSTRDAYYASVGTKHTDIMLMLGDNAYSSGLDSEYQSRFFGVYNTLLRKSHVWSTIGNHETFAGSPFPYYDIFSFPIAAESGGLASGSEAYYSFDHGNIHFVCLDSMVSDPTQSGSMATWLAADLAATTARWNIAYFHHPPYTSGGYSSDTMTEAIAMRSNIVPILEANGIDVVLSGHDHNYMRTWFIGGHYGLSSTFDAVTMKKDTGLGRPLPDGPYVKNVNVSEVNKGSVYVVAGSAASLYSAPTAHPAIAVGLNQLGTVILDISGNRLDMSFLRSDGTIGDNFTIVKPYGTTDSDGDGMSDDYENETGFALGSPADGAADSDGDGRSNRDEFAAGTNPFDRTSFLSSSLRATGGGFNFTFNTVPGYYYTVETKDALNNGEWTPLPAATNLRGTGGERTVTDTAATSSRFYRVRATAE